MKRIRHGLFRIGLAGLRRLAQPGLFSASDWHRQLFRRRDVNSERAG